MASPDPSYGVRFAAAVKHYLTQNNLSSLGKINEPILADIAQRFFDHDDAQKRQKKRLQTDAEWLDGIVADPIFKGLDVRQQHALAIRYCEKNQRKCTRRFFDQTWMPRALSEAGTRPQTGSPVKRTAPECPQWKNVLNHHFPDSVYGCNGARPAERWLDLPGYVHDLIWEAHKKQ